MLYSNQTFSVNGTWNMYGGIQPNARELDQQYRPGTVIIGSNINNAAVNVYSNAVWSFATNAAAPTST